MVPIRAPSRGGSSRRHDSQKTGWSCVAPVQDFPGALGRVKTALRCAPALRGLDPPGALPRVGNYRSYGGFQCVEPSVRGSCWECSRAGRTSGRDLAIEDDVCVEPSRRAQHRLLRRCQIHRALNTTAVLTLDLIEHRFDADCARALGASDWSFATPLRFAVLTGRCTQFSGSSCVSNGSMSRLVPVARPIFPSVTRRMAAAASELAYASTIAR
jgi:hypothetical protein